MVPSAKCTFTSPIVQMLGTLSLTRPRWLEPEPIPVDLPRLHANPLIHELLARRGLQTAQKAHAFLDLRPRHSPDANDLPNLHAAVDRIGRALDSGERIGIFGDYDADGVTATALLTKALRAAAKCPDLISPRLPRRHEGYGLNRAAIDEFAAIDARLLIAVDCGSGDLEHVQYARSRGMDVIALDHHQIQGEPPADAIVVSAQLPGGERLVDLSAVAVTPSAS
jgi:single-stranded-DNA-specific exonuclease